MYYAICIAHHMYILYSTIYAYVILHITHAFHISYYIYISHFTLAFHISYYIYISYFTHAFRISYYIYISYTYVERDVGCSIVNAYAVCDMKFTCAHVAHACSNM